MKITQVTTFYGPNGGVERAVQELSHGLSARGHQVDVLCTKAGATATGTEDGIQVTAVGSAFTIAGRPVAINVLSRLRKQDSDIIHIHLPFPLATLCNVPKMKSKGIVATWHHGLGKYPTFDKFYRPMLRSFLKQVDRIFVAAPQLIPFSNVLEEFSDKCDVIPMGVRLEAFAHADTEAVNRIKMQAGNRPLLLFIGRLVYYKGCDVLVEAMQHIDAVLLMVGDGPLKHDLQKRIAELGLGSKVQFLGRVPDSDLSALYHACDVFVLPSTEPTECFGLVQIEAMACRKPVVNTNLPTGVPWVSIDNESGLTVPPRDSGALACAINRLINEPELRTRLAAGAFERAQKLFTLDQQVSRTVDAYRRILTK